MVTYADDDDGAVLLNDAVPGQIKNSQVRGMQLILRSVLPYVAAARSATSQAAFQDATKFLVGNMMDSITKKLEIELMYGQVGIGVVKNNETAGASVQVEIKASDWAPGVWGGAEKMKVDIYDSTLTTLRNVVSGDAQIASVSFESQSITITSLSANLTAGDIIFPAGAKGKQMAGLHKILSNTGSLFGIDAAQYTLWKGNVFTPGTPGTPEVLSFAIIQQAIAKGVEKGLKGDAMCLVNPGHWDDLLTEQTALRMFDSSYKSDKGENGFKSIKFHSQNGAVEIRPSIYVKEGYAYIICSEDFARVGSTDITFKRPGQGEQFFKDLEQYAGVELRCYTDQALFCVKPGRQVLIDNLKAS